MTDKLQELEARLKTLDADEQGKERVDTLLDAAAELFSGDDPQRLIQVTNEALDIAKKMNYTEGEAWGLWYEGLSCCFIADHERGLKRVDESCQMMEELGDEFGVMKSWYLKANLLRSIGSYGHALELLFKTLDYFLRNDNAVWAGDNYYALGLLYEEIRDCEQALENHEKCIEVTAALPQGWLQARALNGIGRSLHSMDRSQEALDYLHRSLKMFKELDHAMGEARVLDDIGSIYMDMGDYRLALSFHSKGLELRESIGQLRAQCTSMLSIARVHLQVERAAEAIAILSEAMAIAEETQSAQSLYEAHNLCAQAYEMDGQPSKALHHCKEYQRIREEVFNQEETDRIRKLQIAFSVEKAERAAEVERIKNVELAETNERLEALLNELHATQSQLVQSERMAAIGKVVASLMHEMNSPLGASNSAIDVSDRYLGRIAEGAGDPQEVARLIDQVRASQRVSRDANDRISGILDNLRSFIRLDGGERAAMDVREGLDSTIALLENETKGRVEVVREYGDVPEVTCCPGEINQVFMGLLSNAIEAIDGPGRVVVRTSADDHEVRIAVADNGSGIAADQLDRLFEPGFSSSGTRVKAGMGLMVCLNIVQKHGGRIDVDSELTEGSTFTVVLPRRQVAA